MIDSLSQLKLHLSNSYFADFTSFYPLQCISISSTIKTIYGKAGGAREIFSTPQLLFTNSLPLSLGHSSEYIVAIMSKRQKNNSLGFTVTSKPTASKYINTKIALPDTIYAERDRDDSVVGYHYVYRCTEVKQSTRGITFTCLYLNERVKASSPLAEWEHHTDDNSRDDEYQEVREEDFKAARARYQDHHIRIKNILKEKMKEKERSNTESVGSTETSLTEAELEEMHCADLISFVNEHGVRKTDGEGRRLLDLHWRITNKRIEKAKKDGAKDRQMVTRTNVATNEEIHVGDTGAVWDRIRRRLKRANVKDKDYYRSR